ncbi:hypothetical protein CMQ_7359 [Grosmannia clavigera kw1407]|uniref:Uncharacterized protein n=1 Tax=Grosmannia clavigera (strain kw1407 / UAMH 11150) TaxID=655863 RepID=F0XPG2_GROCL|nr:uncharacterized protein CMQ_7359 [Grosmannia clavigera kw1407]EFX00357.1 hypothetical protein CMQ_7359 [Grosmannia clavigera kw1407]
MKTYGLDKPAPLIANVVLNYLATFLGYLHIAMGTLIFSSVTFIEIVDVITVIMRYIASAVVCRAVLNFELAGICLAIAQQAKPAIQEDLANGGSGTGATQQYRPYKPPSSRNSSLSDQDTAYESTRE